MEFYEAFNIANQTMDFGLSGIMALAGVSFISVYGKQLVTTLKLPWNVRHLYPVLWVLLGIGLLAAGIRLYYCDRSRFEFYTQQVNSSDVVSVEGMVNVTFEEPWDGHAGGDIVHVADKTFEVQQYSGSYYYHESIAHGGVLKQNAYVRIYYIPTTDYYRPLFGDGQIVKIECRR
jgi:hypothetical protein